MIVPARTEAAARDLVAFLARRLDVSPDHLDDGPFEVFGVARNGVLRGAVMFTRFADGDITMTCAGDPGWTTRASLRLIFSYPFRQLGCRRVTALVSEINAPMRNYCERMGFVREGIKRQGLPGSDIYLYGMLREECRWA